MQIDRVLNLELPDNNSCFLWGARKTGKSTYLKALFPNSFYIDLLRADECSIYLKNPEKLRERIFSQDEITTIIIDEIQKVPALLDEVHYMMETRKSLQFILCGSSARSLKSTGANLLGGRAWRYNFMPLCYNETKELNWDKIFNNGLLPSNYLATKMAEKYLESYLHDYILPEVLYEANLRKKEAFGRFLEVLGISNGEMINFSNIARDCGVDAKTVRTYFEILEDMYLGYHLYPYKSRAKRQMITETPKFYLFDTGLANYLRRYEYKEMTGIEAGRSFEHYIFLELMAYKNLVGRRDHIFYWRTKEGYEVDFIFQNQAFEVKISSDIDKKHIKGLLEFARDEDFKLNVICFERHKRIATIGDKQVTIWPVQEFLENLWANNIWKK